MQHVQGYTRSHLTLPSGDSLLRIALAAARATSNKTTMQNVPTLLFISMAIAMCRYSIKRIAQWRRSRAFKKPLNAAIGRALAPIVPIGHTNAGWFLHFIVKRARVDMFSPNNNRGMTYESNPKHLSNFREYFIGVIKLTICCYSNHFLWCVFTNNLLKYLSNQTLKKLVKCYVYDFFGRPGLHHTKRMVGRILFCVWQIIWYRVMPPFCGLGDVNQEVVGW